jgi:peptidoglycan glycosyltransferase
VNRQIVKLFAFIVVLFAVLVGFTSYWSVFEAEALREKNANKRPLLEQQQIERGRILADDGTVLARSVAKGRGDALRYVRRYPEGSLFGHPIGYSFVRQGDSQFEQYHNDELIGEESEFTSLLDELRGQEQEGDDVVTNLDPAAQRVALGALEAAGFGAVVGIEPDSGRVRVMASNPPYDPNRVPEHYSELATNEIETPLLNRATQGRYPPGSTFKVVTATAGLDSGTISADSTINAPAVIDVQGLPLANSDGQGYGSIGLEAALTGSVNTWFAQLGEQVGSETLFDYMSDFGFGRGKRAARPRRPGRRGADRDRPGAVAGDAASDGDGRLGRRQRRQPDAAPDLEPGRRSGWPGGEAARPLPVQPADGRGDGRDPDHRDGRRRRLRHGDERRDLGRSRRRQDRDGGNAVQRELRRWRPQSGLVHRLRPG